MKSASIQKHKILVSIGKLFGFENKIWEILDGGGIFLHDKLSVNIFCSVFVEQLNRSYLLFVN